MKKPLGAARFPYSNSWLSAFILFLLMIAFIAIVRNTGTLEYILARSVGKPESLVVLGILVLLLPIPALAFTHHILHLLLSRFSPAIQALEIGTSQGLLPGLISWWEGLYGWLVITLATLTATVFCTVLLPVFNLSYGKITYGYSQAEIKIQATFVILWIVFAANFYQIEYLVKRRLTRANAGSSKPATSTSDIYSALEEELNQLRGEMGLTKMKRKGQSAQTDINDSTQQRKSRRL